MLSEIRTVEYMLGQWGKWAYVSRGIKLSHPCITPTERMRRRVGGVVSISDAEAETIDAVVSSLKHEVPKVHEALSLYYVASMSYRDVARVMGTHHRTVSDWVEQGRMYVRGALSGAPLERSPLPAARHI